MDPITIAIVGAVAKLSETVIKDGYEALKALIVRKYGKDSKLAKAAKDMEENPKSEGRKTVLSEEVAAAKANKDPDLLKAAQDLAAKLKDLPGGQTIITQTVHGNSNIISGSGNITVEK